jgi:molybdate transport system ATP-binding protein
MITHSIPEIFKLSDKVIVLEKGKIIKEGTANSVFSQEKISSKFKVTGEIISITKSDIVYVIQVFSGNTIIKVVATEYEIKDFRIGQKVLVASKAFNPIIQIIS